MSAPARVLVVDDDDGIRESLVDLLGDAGYTMESAAEGKSALALLRGRPAPDAMILDLMMPGVDGWAVLDAIASERLVPIERIIVATAQRAPKLPPGVRWIGKPMEASTVLTAVREACAHAQGDPGAPAQASTAGSPGL